MKPPRRLLIVDGYNVLNARDHMGTLADARERLIHELQDYAGYTGQKIIVVFDAWLGDRQSRSIEECGRVTVVFTRKGETADHFIEHTCDGYAEDVSMRRMEIRVATSDGLEQTIILGRGATRLSSRELLMEMNQVRAQGANTTARAAREGHDWRANSQARHGKTQGDVPRVKLAESEDG